MGAQCKRLLMDCHPHSQNRSGFQSRSGCRIEKNIYSATDCLLFRMGTELIQNILIYTIKNVLESLLCTDLEPIGQ